jgi:hypothetical protein
MRCVNACEQERSFNLKVGGWRVLAHASWTKAVARVAVCAGKNLWT